MSSSTSPRARIGGGRAGRVHRPVQAPGPPRDTGEPSFPWSTSTERLAHDLLNYLAAISGLAQMARMVRETKTKDEYLVRIESAVGDMSGVLDTVLARPASDLWLRADRETVAVLLEEIRTLMEPRFRRRGISFRVRVSSNVPTVMLIRAAVKQALLAVLDNALRATPPDGTVELAARGSHGRLVGLLLVVRDTGSGIPRAIIQKVVGRGYSTRPGGSGLGLFTASEIVERVHGGRLSLKSLTGTGTVVRAFLPCRQAVSQTAK